MRLCLMYFGLLPLLAALVHAQEPVSLPDQSEANPEPEDLKIEVLYRPDHCPIKSQKNDQLSVHYDGLLSRNGFVFDSSIRKGRPISFTVGRGHVIAGWDQGLLDMCVGEKRRLFIPPHLGYGNKGAANGAIPANSALTFKVELMGIANRKSLEEEFKGQTPVQMVDNVVNKYHNVVFSKSYCPHCARAKKLLESASLSPVQLKIIELDQLGGDLGAEIQKALLAKTGQRTVPNIFIKHAHVGGADSVFALHEAGELVKMLFPRNDVAIYGGIGFLLVAIVGTVWILRKPAEKTKKT